MKGVIILILSRKTKIVVIICSIVVFSVLFCSSAVYTRNEYIKIYNEGVSLLEKGNYTDALNRFSDIPNYIDYRDIRELLEEHQIDVCPRCGLILE